MDALRSQIHLAGELGALCGRVQAGEAGVETFLLGLSELLGADGVLLTIELDDGSVACWTRGLDDGRARRLVGGRLEPSGLAVLAGDQVAWRLSDFDDGDQDGLRDRIEEDLLNKLGVTSLLRLAAPGAVALLCRFTEQPDFSRDTVHVLTFFQEMLHATVKALRRRPDVREAVLDADDTDSFAPRIDTAALHAWGICTVPLVLLDSGGAVLSANRSARRKLDVRGNPPTLPTWLSGIVAERLGELRERGGLPPDASGDYQFVRPQGDRRLMRLGLAPVDGVNEDSDGDRWLLSIEHGGPTLDERIRATVRGFELTAKEAEILDLLADGLTNKKIADALNIVEATVKYRLKRIMDKTQTESRTDLLATVYSQLPERSTPRDG